MNQELGWLDWHKVHDPEHKIDIEPDAFDRLEKYFDPQDIQEMFDEYGTEEAILRINREFLIRHDKYALEMVKIGQNKLLKKAE